MKIYLNLNYQSNENIQCFSQETNNFQILGNEALIIDGYEDINIFTFHK